MSEVTRILNAVEQGDPCAADQLLPLVYDELRKLAAAKMARERPGQTLDATALVHEAYVRLVGADDGFSNRRHFFAAAAEVMRRILVENARRKARVKHGGDHKRQILEPEHLAVLPEAREDLEALDEALQKLHEENPKVVELVKLRYFAGMTIKEAAELLDISPRTADAKWAYARAWLLAELQNNSK